MAGSSGAIRKPQAPAEGGAKARYMGIMSDHIMLKASHSIIGVTLSAFRLSGFC